MGVVIFIIKSLQNLSLFSIFQNLFSGRGGDPPQKTSIWKKLKLKFQDQIFFLNNNNNKKKVQDFQTMAWYKYNMTVSTT
jgi:hypothetical protein